MKYSVPFKKITTLLNQEIEDSELAFIIHNPIGIHNNDFFIFIQHKIFSNITNNCKISEHDILNPSFSYDSVPLNIRLQNDIFFNDIKDAFHRIKEKKLSEANSRELVNSIAMKNNNMFMQLNKYSANAAQDFFEYFQKPSEILYYSNIIENLFDDKIINIDLGNQNGIPDKSLNGSENLANFVSLLIRPNQPLFIDIESKTPEIVIKALLPGSSIVPLDNDSFFNEDFSFKNDKFIDTINEDILDDTFIQVSNIESILLNIDSYIEDIDLFIKKYGFDNYIDTLIDNEIISTVFSSEKKDSINKDFSKLLNDFYYFISIIPIEFIYEEQNLQKIADKLSKNLESLNNQSLMFPHHAMLSPSSDENFKKISNFITEKTPFSIDKIISHLPQKEIIEKIKKEEPGYIKNVVEYLKKQENNIASEIYQQCFSLEDIQKFLKGNNRADWLNVISIIPNIFPDLIYQFPEVRETILAAIKSSLTISISDSYIDKKVEHSSNKDFLNFIKTMNLEEIDTILNFTLDMLKSSNKTLQNSYETTNGFSFSVKETYNNNSIIEELLSCKTSLLIADFISVLHQAKNNPENLQLKDKSLQSFNQLSQFIENTKNNNLLLFPQKYEINHNDYLSKIMKNQSYEDVQEFFIFNIFTEEIYNDTPHALTQCIFKIYKNHYHAMNMEQDPSFYISHIQKLQSNTPKLASFCAQYINMNDLITKKHDFTQDVWFNLLEDTKINGDIFQVIQKIITQAGSDIEKLKKCQNLIIKQKSLFNVQYNNSEFKIKNKALKEIQNNPQFSINLPYFLDTCPNIFEQLPTNIKYNPDFWISIAEELKINTTNNEKTYKVFQHIEDFLFKDKNVLLALLPIYNEINNILNENLFYNFSKKYEAQAILLFKKPKHLLELVEKYSNNEILFSTLTTLQPELYQFAQMNKIKNEDLFHTINTIIQQTFMEADTKTVSSSKSHNLKF